jgi:hypothetical protein
MDVLQFERAPVHTEAAARRVAHLDRMPVVEDLGSTDPIVKPQRLQIRLDETGQVDGRLVLSRGTGGKPWL